MHGCARGPPPGEAVGRQVQSAPVYITQQNNSLFHNYIVYTRICFGDWTKVS